MKMIQMENYYAKAVDLSGMQFDIPVTEDGTVQISSVLKIKALETNALKVFCRNNELQTLIAPNAVSVGCNKNKLTSLHLENAENVHCGENKLTELYAPKATVVKCYINQLTELRLDSAVEIECYGNDDLKVIYAPNLRKIDRFENLVQTENFASRKEIEITIKNHFDRRDPEGYTTETFDLEIALDLDKPRTVDNVAFAISIYDPAVMFEVCLMERNDQFGQQASIAAQIELPFVADKPMRFAVSVPIRSYVTGTKNLLDIIREAPESERVYEREFHIDVTCYLESQNTQDKSFTKTFAIGNPFAGRYQWETDLFTEPATMEQDEKFLPEALAKVSDDLEDALLELFELHRDEIAEIAGSVDGISYDILPHERYAAISFRTTEDEERYSPADWENYSLLEYSNCKSEKFKVFSKRLFQLFFEIQASSDDFEDIETRINDLLFTAIAKAVLRSPVAEKLRVCGISKAPILTDTFDKTVEYIVSASEYGEDPFNYCESVISDTETKPTDGRIRLDKF